MRKARTLCKRINEEDREYASCEICKVVFAGGKRLKGLVDRR
ncbi:glycoside hydrolase family protein [Candidatus Liberibacter sp.]